MNRDKGDRVSADVYLMLCTMGETGSESFSCSEVVTESNLFACGNLVGLDLLKVPPLKYSPNGSSDS